MTIEDLELHLTSAGFTPMRELGGASWGYEKDFSLDISLEVWTTGSTSDVHFDLLGASYEDRVRLLDSPYGDQIVRVLDIFTRALESLRKEPIA